MSLRRSTLFFSFITMLVVALLAVSCGSRTSRSGSSGQIIVPKPAEGMSFGSSVSSAENRSRPPEEIPPVKVPLGPDYLVQQVIDVNLDLDDMDEQVVVFKRRNGSQPANHATPQASAPASAAPQGAAGAAALQGSPNTQGAAEGGTLPPAANGPADAEGTPIGVAGAAANATDSAAGTVTSAGETVQDLEERTANDTIWIMVVDFDTVRNTYVVAWEAPTLATNIRTFKVQEMDLLGDHNLEIVCQGLNARGEQTIDVFKRVNSPASLGLKYQNILSLTSDGSTEIQQVDRSDAYHSAQALGKSFPIVTLTRDKESSNPLDMVRTTYFYRSQDGKYVKGVTEQVSGSRIEEAQLTNLYNGTAETFEDFLNGPWYKTNDSGAGTDAGPPTAQSVDIMFYNRHGREITFAHGEIEQSFTIEESYKTAFQRGIQLKIRNDAIPTMREFAAISVPALDTIIVAVQGDDSWNGTYKRLSGGLHQALLSNGRQGVSIAKLDLSGLYKDDNGTEVFFSSPRFTIRENGTERNGEFLVYADGEQRVLELRILSETGQVEERRLYIVEYKEESTKTQIVRILNMTPAVVSVHGFEPLNNQVNRFEQIERREQAGRQKAAPAQSPPTAQSAS